jgi:hypothetical protein
VSEPCRPVRLESVSPPYPAALRTHGPSSELEKASSPVRSRFIRQPRRARRCFNQLNRQTGHRIKYLKVDADTGDKVPNEDIVKGYKIGTDTSIEVTKEELENVALESTRTIEIDEFVDKTDIGVNPQSRSGGRPL